MSGGKLNTWAMEQEKNKAREAKKRKEAELAEMELLFGKAIPAGGKKAGNFADFKSIDPKAKSKKGIGSKKSLNFWQKIGKSWKKTQNLAKKTQNFAKKCKI